jgi:hypothetical protein
MWAIVHRFTFLSAGKEAAERFALAAGGENQLTKR